VTETKGRLLVIDDEEGIREGCRRVLGPEGYEVVLAGTLAEGRRAIEADAFDMILLDVMMPDGKGIDLLEPIRQRDPACVAAIITGYATVELAVQAMKQGAYDFISKPFSADLLLLTVERGMERRRLAQEARRLGEVEAEAAELTRTKEEMERLDKFKSAFMLTVAHELRAPVAGAQSLLRTMMRGMAGDLTEEQHHILDRVEIRHRELMDLINDLLALAESKTAAPERPVTAVDAGAALAKVVDRFRDEAQAAGVSLAYEPSGNAALVKATPDGLETVFVNLIGNAVKYTPKGGRVVVGLSPGPQTVRVSVADTGIGIDPAAMSRLGEEFYRAENAKSSGIPGTGLGLAIVRQHLDRWGAGLDVQSTPGKGSTFTVDLPRAS
jgi:two-component system sensor histidine kinase/response regulator